MGLAIRARLVTGPGVEDEDYRLYNNPDFPGRADLPTGWYKAVGLDHPSLQWSYSGYSAFRERLARLAYPEAPDLPRVDPYKDRNGDWDHRHPASAYASKLGSGPLFELIWFSDCEGILGHETCKKLLADLEALNGDWVKSDGFAGRDFAEDFRRLRLALKAVVDAGPQAVLDFS